MAITKLGKVTAIPKGNYNPDETYERLDIVLHNGNTYMSRKTSRGIPPQPGIVTEHWMPYGQSVYIATTDKSGIVRPDGTSLEIKDPATGQIGVGDAKYIPVSSETFEGNTVESVLEELDTENTELQNMLSDAWISGKTYKVGSYAIHNNKLWKCLVQNSVEPTEGSNWTQVRVSDEISQLNSNLAQLGTLAINKVISEQGSGTSGHYYQIGKIVFVHVTITKPNSSWDVLRGFPIPYNESTTNVGVLSNSDEVEHVMLMGRNGTLQVRSGVFTDTFSASFSYVAK